MGKIEEAKQILASFGLGERQQNDRSARVLLALTGIQENMSWSQASNRMIGIHNIIIFISENYKFTYAENSRETIRRQSIHQFEQAGIVIRNPDAPNRPTNSGKTVYSITPQALKAIQNFDTKKWPTELNEFLLNASSLIQKYRKERKIHQVSIKINNEEYYLSPGKHNILQKAVLEKFAPRFAKGGMLLYIGDTAHKIIYMDEDNCQKVKIDILRHEKLPDLVLFEERKNWLFLIEAITSHGPMSEKRVIELKDMLSQFSGDLIFISAFPDISTFQKYASEICWETDVWIANTPDHMIHFNGDKFLGPYN